MSETSRRGFLTGLGALAAAPLLPPFEEKVDLMTGIMRQPCCAPESITLHVGNLTVGDLMTFDFGPNFGNLFEVVGTAPGEASLVRLKEDKGS